MTASNNPTVYLGVYNGEKYLPSLKIQLLTQKNQNFQILVIDNASTDNSWEILNEWKVDFGDRISVYRNHLNIGAGGSLARALSEDLINSDWVITMHQDDFYFSNHIDVISKVINHIPNDVVAICTGMASMNEQSKKVATPPRAAWLMNDHSSPNSFLSNLRTQTLTFPSAAFRTKDLGKCYKYWHSSSFDDTEASLKLCGYGEFRYILQETMMYRENPHSASHSVNLLESQIGASVSLSRVFVSEEFRKVLTQVRLEERGLFFSELISALEIRLKDAPLLYLIQLLASEECCRVWGYSVQEPLLLLGKYYQAMDSKSTSNLMSSLSNRQKPDYSDTLISTFREISGEFSNAIFSEFSHPKSKLNLVFSKLPLQIRIRVFRIYVRLFAIKQPNHYWNAFWK